MIQVRAPIPPPNLLHLSHKSPEIDEIQAMQGEEVKELVEGAAETTSCKDRMKREYYTPENLAREEIGEDGEVIKTGDLWEFTKAAGLNHPTQLNTGNIRSVPITCSNGEPEVKGQTYLNNAAIAFGYAKNAPPPAGPVRVNSDTMDVKTAPTAASKAFPPDFKISRADSRVGRSPAAIAPYFIQPKRLLYKTS